MPRRDVAEQPAEYFKVYDVVFVSNRSAADQIKINAKCREVDTMFYCGDVCGPSPLVFNPHIPARMRTRIGSLLCGTLRRGVFVVDGQCVRVDPFALRRSAWPRVLRPWRKV